MNHHEYLTVQQIADDSRYPFSVGQLRNFLMLRHRNGLEKATRKIGKRVYLRRDLFERWIESKARKQL